MLRQALFIILIACAGLNAFSQPKLVVDGAPRDLSENIHAHIDLSLISKESWDGVNRRRVLKNVRVAAEALGYYQIQATDHWSEDTLHLTIVPGSRVTWTTPSITLQSQGIEPEALQRLVKDHPFVPSEPFLHATYDEYKSALLRQAEESGFLGAAYTESQLILDTGANTAEARLLLALGPIHRVRTLSFSESQISIDILERVTDVNIGEVYTPALRREVQRRLENFGAFRHVAVTIQRSDSGHVDIKVTLEDKADHELQIGLGFGTDTGIRTRFRWIWPIVNDGAHRMSSEVRLSEPEQELTTSYYIPLDDPSNRNFEISATWEREEIEDKDSNKTELGGMLNNTLGEGRLISYGAKLIHEDYRIGDDPRVDLTYLQPELTLDYLILPPGTDPRDGHRTWLSTGFSTEDLGAEAHFLRFDVGHKRLISLADNHDIIGRAEIGVLVTDDINEVPASQRFYTGGDQTVRGYDYQSIAPKDDQGNLIGGKYLNVLSFEYNYRLLERWKMAIFTDAGRVYNEKHTESWRKSIGIGVRWISPIGQVRIDVATPLEDDEDGIRLHIFMGPAL